MSAQRECEEVQVSADLATALDLLDGYGHVALAKRLRRAASAGYLTLTDLRERPYATTHTDDLITLLSAPFPAPGEREALRDELRRRVHGGGVA